MSQQQAIFKQFIVLYTQFIALYTTLMLCTTTTTIFTAAIGRSFHNDPNQAIQIKSSEVSDNNSDYEGPKASLKETTTAFLEWTEDAILVGERHQHQRHLQQQDDSMWWVQLGGDIDGENFADALGYSVALSLDRRTAVVGVPGYRPVGRVQVFRYSNNSMTWEQIGQSIDGNRFDNPGGAFGRSVDISDDGNTIVSGGPYDLYGFTRVYRLVGDLWEQVGEDIAGKDIAGEVNPGRGRFGWVVSISSDGKTVAASSNGPGGAGVFSFINDAWQIKGDFLEDANYIDLSSDGNTVAIEKDDVAKVYQYTGTTWEQLGGDIDADDASEQWGSGLAISGDGGSVIVGYPYYGGSVIGSQSGRARIFRYDVGWIQLGSDIVGESANDWSGWSVDISDDGYTVAIGAQHNSEAGQVAGHGRVFRYDAANADWSQVGADVDGEEAMDEAGHFVGLSGNGDGFIIGSIFNSGTGHARVYELTDPCSIEYPDPIISFVRAQPHSTTTYRNFLQFENKNAFDGLFVPAPETTQCTDPSRTCMYRTIPRVEYKSCGSTEGLPDEVSIYLNAWQAHSTVYVRFEDCLCGKSYRSNIISIPAHLSTPEPTPPPDSCSIQYPDPIISFDRFEVYTTTQFRNFLKFENGDSFDGLFVPAPNLVPCGTASVAARTWLYTTIPRIEYQSCALTSGIPDQVSIILDARDVHDTVYVRFLDLVCGKQYRSNIISLPAHLSPTTTPTLAPTLTLSSTPTFTPISTPTCEDKTQLLLWNAETNKRIRVLNTRDTIDLCTIDSLLTIKGKNQCATEKFFFLLKDRTNGTILIRKTNEKLPYFLGAWGKNPIDALVEVGNYSLWVNPTPGEDDVRYVLDVVKTC